MVNPSIRLGTLWTIIFFVASFAKTIILTPLMLVHWGQELFSFWAIILSARAIILFLSDGYIRFVLNQYNLLFHNDEPMAKTVLASGISFLIVFSLFLCVLLAFFLLAFPSVSFFVFDAQLSYLAPCLIAYIIAACVQNIQRIYAASKEAVGLVWHNMFFEVCLIIVELSSLSILLFRDFSFQSVVWADSGIILVVALIYIFHLWVQYPLQNVLKRTSIHKGWVDFKKATKLYASNFFEKLSTDGLVLLLSFFRFDKAAIALFATVRTIVNTPLLAQNLLLNTYTPEMQKHFSLGNTESLQKLFKFIRLRIGALLCLGIVLCLPLYEPVFVYWTKGKIDYDETFMLSMLAMAVFNLYGISFAFVFKGVNALVQLLALMLLKAILLFIALIWLSPNLLAFAIALLVIEIISSVLVLPLMLQKYGTQHKLQFSLLENAKQLLPYLLTALCLFLWHIYT